MAVKISSVLNDQQFNSNGVMLSGGKIETYLAGSTTPATTFTSDAGTVSQPNPIILNTRGEVPNLIYLTTGVKYKFLLKDAANNLLRTYDNIEGVNDSASSIDQWINTSVLPTYINATQFSLAGDQTATFTVNRRIKILVTAGTLYGYISASVFTTLTTITVVLDSGILDSGLSSVQVGLVTPNNSSIRILTGQMAFDSGALSLRNKIINGAMKIDQRNDGAAKSIIAGSAISYVIDRYYTYCTGANITGQRIVSTANVNRYRFTGAAGSTGLGFGQRIEAAQCMDLAGQTAIWQVKIASSQLNSLTWTAYYANTTDTFGSLATPTRTQIATGTFNVGSIEAIYSSSFPVPIAASTGIEIVFTGGALTTSSTLSFGDLQLEQGSLITPFEQRPPAFESMLCKRRYEQSSKGILSLGLSVGAISYYTKFSGQTLQEIESSFEVEKAATPTIIWYSTSGASGVTRNGTASADISVTGTNASTKRTGAFTTSAIGTVNTQLLSQWSAEVEL